MVRGLTLVIVQMLDKKALKQDGEGRVGLGSDMMPPSTFAAKSSKRLPEIAMVLGRR